MWIYLKYYQDNSDMNEQCNNFVTNGLLIKRPKSKFMYATQIYLQKYTICIGHQTVFSAYN